MFILRGLWSLYVVAVVLVGIIFGNLIAQYLLPRVHLESASQEALLFSPGSTTLNEFPWWIRLRERLA